jgi:phosphoribosylformylglycinamidine synthase
VVGGNVSFYNETEGRAIPPTPTIGMVGLIEDSARHMTQWFKTEGSVIVLLGRTLEEFGGSEYLSLVHAATGSTPPWIDLSVERNVQQACSKAIAEDLLDSAHDVAEGGLAVALAECCMTGPKRLGAVIDSSEAIRPDALLFGESQSRIVVSLRRNNLTRVREIAAAAEVPFEILGEVRGRRLVIQQHVDLDVDDMHAAWSNALPQRLEKTA